MTEIHECVTLDRNINIFMDGDMQEHNDDVATHDSGNASTEMPLSIDETQKAKSDIEYFRELSIEKQLEVLRKCTATESVLIYTQLSEAEMTIIHNNETEEDLQREQSNFLELDSIPRKTPPPLSPQSSPERVKRPHTRDFLPAPLNTLIAAHSPQIPQVSRTRSVSFNQASLPTASPLVLIPEEGALLSFAARSFSTSPNISGGSHESRFPKSPLRSSSTPADLGTNLKTNTTTKDSLKDTWTETNNKKPQVFDMIKFAKKPTPPATALTDPTNITKPRSRSISE